MAIKVIKAEIEHADELGYVHSNSWKLAYEGIVPDEVINEFTPEKRADIFREALTGRDEEYYIFIDNDNYAGFAILYKSHEETAKDSEGEIYAIYFLPEYWGTNVTDEAFKFCMDRLVEMGFKSINIWVLEKNVRARGFYEKHGFKADGGRMEIDLGIPLSEIRYSKKV